MHLSENLQCKDLPASASFIAWIYNTSTTDILRISEDNPLVKKLLFFLINVEFR